MSGGRARVAGVAKARAVPNTSVMAKIGHDAVGSVARVHRETDDGDGLRGQADRRDAPAVVAVGERTGHEHEQRVRREHGEADQAQVDLFTGEVEDLLAEDRVERERSRRRRERREEERSDGPSRAGHRTQTIEPALGPAGTCAVLRGPVP